MSRACGFTGTRHGLTLEQAASLNRVFARLYEQGFRIMHNGVAIGADEESVHLAVGIGFEIVAHPSTIAEQRSETALMLARDSRPFFPPLTRNYHIVSESEILVAAPKHTKPSKQGGTWWTVRNAVKRGRAVITVWPDGRVT